MCGITGYIGNNLKFQDFKDATNRQKHRGPDSTGYFSVNTCGVNVLMGHNRLAIVDLDERSAQPFKDGENRGILVYNGEVYNYDSLFGSHLKSHSQFRATTSDTEVVLMMLNQYGVESVKLFNGMFAFGYYDIKNKIISLVRDRFGVKPLYYIKTEKDFYYSSELHFVQKFSQRVISPASLQQFICYGYTSSENSFYDDINQVPPGGVLEYNLATKEIKVRRFWNSNLIPQKKELIGYQEYKSEIHRLLIKSIQSRLKSDVEVGVFLSGGIDSSLVAAIAKNHSSQRFKTFTIGFDEKSVNELPYAKIISNHLKVDNISRILTNEELINAIDPVLDIFGEPFGDSSAIPTYYSAKLAADNGVKVVLGADGGDEVFAGYSKYQMYNFIITNQKFLSLFSKFLNFLPQLQKSFNGNNKLAKLYELIDQSTTSGVLSLLESRLPFQDLKLLMKGNVILASHYKEVGEKNFADNKLSFIQIHDVINYLVGDILQKVDRVTMHNSIEGREPFLDHELYTFSMKYGHIHNYRSGCLKFVLKDILSDYLPRSLFDRRKQGFGIPLASIAKKHLGLRTLDLVKNDNKINSILNRESVLLFIENYLNKNKHSPSLIYNLYSLYRWGRNA